MKLLYGSCASCYCVLLVWLMWVGSVIVVLFSEEFNMNKEQIAAKIKETEEQLACLRKQLEEPEYPTLADSKPGDKLKDGCIVVHKMEDIRMALIAAPIETAVYYKWSKEFSEVFECLSGQGFNMSQWFIPTVDQLRLAYSNCKEHFAARFHWSSTEASSALSYSYGVHFNSGRPDAINKSNSSYVRAFSLSSY